MAGILRQPIQGIARASRAGMPVTPIGDKMTATTTQEATTTNDMIKAKMLRQSLQAHRFIAHYMDLIDSGLYFDADERSAKLHEEGRAINLYMMLQDISDALSGDLEWEAE